MQEFNNQDMQDYIKEKCNCSEKCSLGTDGYILSVLGLYLSNGKNNDASIYKHMIKGNAEEMLTWLQEGDSFVVDRGFRDSIDDDDDDELEFNYASTLLGH